MTLKSGPALWKCLVPFVLFNVSQKSFSNLITITRCTDWPARNTTARAHRRRRICRTALWRCTARRRHPSAGAWTATPGTCKRQFVFRFIRGRDKITEIVPQAMTSAHASLRSQLNISRRHIIRRPIISTWAYRNGTSYTTNGRPNTELSRLFDLSWGGGIGFE